MFYCISTRKNWLEPRKVIDIRTNNNIENFNSLVLSYVLILQIIHPFMSGCKTGELNSQSMQIHCESTSSKCTGLPRSWGSEPVRIQCYGYVHICGVWKQQYNCHQLCKIQMFRYVDFRNGVAGTLMVFACLMLLWHKGGNFHNFRMMGRAGIWSSVLGWILIDFEQFLWLSPTTFINETDPESLWEFSNMIVQHAIRK